MKQNGDVVFERNVPRNLDALHVLRRGVADALSASDVSKQMTDDALLVLSELTTNAMHAAGYGDSITTRVLLSPAGDLDIEVEDPGGGFRLSEGLRIPAHDEEHGRGLAIVCLLADETTVRRRRRRTVVRARLCARQSA